MAYLRKAVDQQKVFLIKKLIQAGAIHHTEEDIYSKTVTELENEYKRIVAQKGDSTA